MKNKSFTLIDLLLVISIIGLLTLVIVSGLRSTTDRAKIARTLLYQASLHRSIGYHLVGWWNFNHGEDSASLCGLANRACDISGYNNHGILVNFSGDPYVEGVPGKEGHGLIFESEDYLNFGDSSSLRIEDEISFSVWVKIPNPTTGTHIIFAKGSGSDTDYWADIRSSGVFLWGGYGVGGTWYVSSNPEITEGDKWYHLAGTYNRIRNEAYINGVLAGDTGRSWQINTSNTDLQAGKRGSTGSFIGTIDDLRIYNTALTAEEIQRIYTETKHKYLATE